MFVQATLLAAVLLSRSSVPYAAIPSTAAPAYEIVDLGDFGGELAYAAAISASGQVVGAAETPFTLHPFLWKDAPLIDLGYLTAETTQGSAEAISADGAFIGGQSYAPFPLGGWSSHPTVWTAATGIQDLLPAGSSKSGVVVGINSSGLAAGNLPDGGFLWRKDTGIRLLSVPGALAGFVSTVNGLSESGIACGYQVMSATTWGAWKYDSARDEYTLLPNLGGHAAFAYGVNRLGDVVGTSSRPNNQMRPLMWTHDGGIVDLGFLLTRYFSQGEARAINDARWIVGWDSYDFDGRLPIGWLWIDGRKYPLNERIADPEQRTEWPFLFPLAINNAGQIVGQGGKDPEGQDGRAFLMTPLPAGTLVAPPAHSGHASPGRVPPR